MMYTTIVNYRDVGDLKKKQTKNACLYSKPVFNDKITPERRDISV